MVALPLCAGAKPEEKKKKTSKTAFVIDNDTNETLHIEWHSTDRFTRKKIEEIGPHGTSTYNAKELDTQATLISFGEKGAEEKYDKDYQKCLNDCEKKVDPCLKQCAKDAKRGECGATCLDAGKNCMTECKTFLVLKDQMSLKLVKFPDKTPEKLTEPTSWTFVRLPTDSAQRFEYELVKDEE